MISGAGRRRSLTSEIADQTTKKNGFEERRLQRKLQELHELSLKQQKKHTEEQLEYALCNLSLEDMDTFNGLTRRILRSGFLPPINSKARVGNNDVGARVNGNKSEVIAERLRGSKMMQRYMEGRGPRKLTRTLSADSGMISCSVENAENATEQRNDRLNPNYTAFIQMHRHRRPVSLTEVDTRMAGAQQNQGTVSLADKVTAPRVKTDGFLSPKNHTPDRAVLAAFDQSESEQTIQHQTVGEAIQYKLKMRELSRKSK